jgi:hypothetical protein
MKKLLTLAIICFSWQTTFSQHEHHEQMRKDSSKNQDMDMNMSVPMSHSYSPNLPMNRNGSGTGWLPDASPMYGVMLHSQKWMYMIHGNVFLRYTKQDLGNKGSRGGGYPLLFQSGERIYPALMQMRKM